MSAKGQIAPLYIIIKQWKWNGCGNGKLNPDSHSTYLYKIIVFVGKISTAIEKELDNFAKKFDKKYTNSELDKYFGKGFVKTITELIDSSNIEGGAKSSNNENENTQNKESNENEISFDDIFASTSDDSTGTSSILDALKHVDAETKDFKILPELPIKDKKTAVAYTGTPRLEFIYQTIWSVDTPMDLRDKIWVYMNIPSFCQYLTVTNNTSDIIPLYYNIYNNNKLVRLSIENVLLTKETYNNIPILNHYYAFRDFFFIQTLDNFELMNKFANTNHVVLDLHDARDYLCTIDLATLRKDKNMEQLLYYGFFILFWPMFTEDAFHEYVVANGNISELAKMYPDLLPRQSEYKTANEKEYKLFNLFYTLTESGTSSDKKLLAEIEKDLYVRIAKNTIINFSYGENRRIILSLRNLFDRLVLTEEIVAVKYSTLYANQLIHLHKTYKTTKELTSVISLNSLLIRCILSETIIHDKQKHLAQNILDVHIFENGNYSVKCEWDDSTHYTFDAVIKVAAEFINKKIVGPINKMKGDVIHYSYDLIPISHGIVKFAHISAEIYYRKNLDMRNLQLFRFVMHDFYEAKLFTTDLSKQGTDFNLIYYLRKGNHQQDRDLLHKKYLNIANTYEYLTKASVALKWAQIYVRNKGLNITLRHTDLKFTLSGMWDTEFNITYSYILLALYMLYSNDVQKNTKYNAAIGKDTKSEAQLTEKRNIKSLKQIDPVLYDFKRYNSDLVYSKICQKPNQPNILTIAEYKALPEKEKTKAIKYWNFTTQTDTYYYAPNPKYPYINFIVGKHPLNYCIPCAKKTSFEKKSNLKHKIYEACMNVHAYEQGRKNIITDTRYIMNYGKAIDAGRLCKLPENTLEPLFYEGYYENAGFEDACYQTDKFFLVGIDQNWEGITNMGILNILSAALEQPIPAIIVDIKKKISANPTMFGILLNGRILRDFYDHKEFIDVLTKVFITRTLVDDKIFELDWAAIFIDVMFYYFNIVIVEFVDMKYRESDMYEDDSNIPAKTEKKNVNVEIEEVLPGDFVELKINQRIDVITTDAGTQYRYIIILKKYKELYPIYLANPVVYFKTKVINKRVFDRADSIIGIFAKFLLYTKRNLSQHSDTDVQEEDSLAQLTLSTNNEHVKSKYVESFYSTLNAITEFLDNKIGAKYALDSLYVNAHNMCYYIAIKDKREQTTYLPVILTNWSPRKNVRIEYKPYQYHNNMELKTLNKFLTEYNLWISTNYDSEGIRIDKWIASTKGKVFGFMFGSINYYFNDISESAALAIKKVPVWVMPYDIVEINKQIHTNASIKSDPLVKEISDGFYNNHLYQLLILEFNALFAREKNCELRTKLKKLIMNSDKNTLVELFDEIAKVLTKYYADFIDSSVTNENTSTKNDATDVNADRIIAEETRAIWESLKMEDYNRLIDTVNYGIVNFMDKSDIFRIVDQSIFNFDKMAINKFKTMQRDKIKKELLAYSKKIIQFGAIPKVTDIPNILVPCTTGSAYYCRANKLIMSEKQLNILLDILVADIQNPLKEKWIFAPIFTDNIINFLKFEARPLESINVEFA